MCTRKGEPKRRWYGGVLISKMDDGYLRNAIFYLQDRRTLDHEQDEVLSWLLEERELRRSRNAA